jgi:filamentous hemagglutinin family protein
MGAARPIIMDASPQIHTSSPSLPRILPPDRTTDCKAKKTNPIPENATRGSFKTLFTYCCQNKRTQPLISRVSMKLPTTVADLSIFTRNTVAISVSLSLALTPAMVFSLPQGGVVNAGQATIADGVGRVDIHQASDKAVIDWRGFDLAPGETTEFYQPGSNALTVNRVGSDSASIINGAIKANGNVMVINPNGMLFGGKSNVDVNGLIASTADADNAALMGDGTISLNKPGKANAAIINQGYIKTRDGGKVGMLAPNISNQGIIEAKLGKVHLASGDTATVDLYGDGLIHAAVSDKVTKQLVENSGIISTQGGSIAITAAAGDQIVDSLINLGGVLDARSVGNKRGKITVQAHGSNAIKGNKASDKGKKSGSSTVLVSGIIDASGRGAGEGGGNVTVTGDDVALLNGSFIDASGNSGKSGTTEGKDIFAIRDGSAGGDIRIGGDYLGGGETPTAKNLYVDPGAFILNDAIQSGDAGRTIFWSDGTTEFYGNVFARALGGNGVDPVTGSAIQGDLSPGALAKGDGGFVETSGHGHLDAGGYVDLTASSGKRGTYFLDPADITIYGNVDPAFQSTSGAINLSTNLKLWIDAGDASKVNLAFTTDALSGATATGNVGDTTVITSVNVASNLYVGARIRLGVAGANAAASTMGADTYVVTGIAGTTLTLSAPLTQTYTGSTLYSGRVESITDKSSSAANATQTLLPNQPLYISGLSGSNGKIHTKPLPTAPGPNTGQYLATPSLSLANGSNQTSVFSAFNPDSIPYNTPYRSTNDAVGLTITGAGTYFHVNFHANSTSGPASTVGATTATEFQYDGSTISGYINGAFVSSANYSVAVPASILNIGTRDDAHAGHFDGYINDVIAYNKTLTANERNLVEQYQSAKWNIALDPVAGAGTEVAEATGATGYSVFTTRYLERLSQTADISLQATNNITLDLKTDTLALANNRNLTLTAGNQINTASAGTITTTGTGTINFNAADYNQLHALTLNGAGGTTITADTINLGANIAGTGTLTLQPASNAQPVNLNNGAAGFALDTAEIGRIQDGWSQINIGQNYAGDLVNIGTSTWSDPVRFRGGAVARNVLGSITGIGNAGISLFGANNITMSAGTSITTAGQPVSIESNLTVNGSNSINTNGGSFTHVYETYLVGGNGLTVDTAGGNITFCTSCTIAQGAIPFGTSARTVSLNAGSGIITFNGRMDGAFNLSASGSTINFGGLIGSITPLSTVSLTTANALSVQSINAATILARTTGATSDITIPVGKILTASANGSAITLAAGRNVINNAGSGALSTPSGRWLLYLPTENTSTLGGLTADFAKYGCPYATCGLPASGNGFLYAGNPVASGGSGGGGTSIPFSNPVITTLPAVPAAPAVSIPVTPTTPIEIATVTPPAIPAPVTQDSDSDFPSTVERVSIDLTPATTTNGFDAPATFQSVAASGNERPMIESVSSPVSTANASDAGDAQPMTTTQEGDNRRLSVWEGLLTIAPELARSLGLNGQDWE